MPLFELDGLCVGDLIPRAPDIVGERRAMQRSLASAQGRSQKGLGVPGFPRSLRRRPPLSARLRPPLPTPPPSPRPPPFASPSGFRCLVRQA